MKAAPVLMAASLAFLLGLGVGMSMGGGDEAPEPVEEPVAAAPAATPPETTRAEPRPPPPRKPASLDEMLAQALADLPEPAVARGTGVLTGHVFARNGKPVSGVTVHADPPAVARGEEDAQPTAASLLEDARRARWMRANRRTTTSGADGAFRFDDLVDVVYSVTATLEGFDVKPPRFRRPRVARPGARLEFEASPIVVVDVDVRMPDGTPPDSAVLRKRNERLHRWTPQQREIRLEPGVHLVRAFVGDRYASEEWRLELEAGSNRASFLLELKPRTGFRGTLVHPPDEIGGGALVFYRRLPAGREVDSAWLKAGEKIDGGNPFRVLDLEPGTYRVGATRHEHFDIAVFEDVVVESGLVETRLELPAPPSFRCATLRVLDPHGEDLTDVTIRLRYDYAGGGTEGFGTAVRTTDAAFKLVPGEFGGEGASHTATITSRTYGMTSVDFELGGEDEIVVRFRKPGLVRVRIDGYASSNIEGTVVASLEEPQHRRGFPSLQKGAPDRDGELTLGPVQPGDYAVALWMPAARGEFDQISSTPVSVESGANLLTVSAPVSYSLSVVVPGSGGKHVVLTSVGKDQTQYHGTRPVNDAGRAVFQQVPPGEYQVRVFGGKKRTITVPDTLEVRF